MSWTITIHYAYKTMILPNSIVYLVSLLKSPYIPNQSPILLKAKRGSTFHWWVFYILFVCLLGEYLDQLQSFTNQKSELPCWENWPNPNSILNVVLDCSDYQIILPLLNVYIYIIYTYIYIYTVYIILWYYTYSIFFRLSLDFVSSIGEVAMAKSSDYPVPASMMRTSCACSARRRSANISGVGKEPLGHVETLSSHISSLDGEKPYWGRAFFPVTIHKAMEMTWGWWLWWVKSHIDIIVINLFIHFWWVSKYIERTKLLFQPSKHKSCSAQITGS